MALDAIEGIIVATLALMLLLWGPEKVAELVRLGNRLRRDE